MHYLFLSSEDSKLIHSNTNSDFTIELPTALEGKFTCGVTQIKINNTTKEDLCVYCDIIEESYINDSLLPLLRVIKRSNTFNPVYYFNVKQIRIPRIKIWIRTRSGSKPQLTGKTSLTLALKNVG